MKAINEIGNRHGQWTVLERTPNRIGFKGASWLCRCDCGRVSAVQGGALRGGYSTRCRWCAGSGFIDLSGQRFGKWTVLKRVPIPKGYHKTPYYRVKCDCGNEANVQAGALRSGKTTQCRDCAHKLPKGDAAFNRVLLWYKKHAEERNLIWDLTREFFGDLIKQNCHWCGIEPSTIYTPPSENGRIVYNGIDRIKNDKGYIFGNVVPCCAECNSAKQARTVKEWTAWIKRLAERYNETPEIFKP